MTITELKYMALNPCIFNSFNYLNKILKEELNKTLKKEIIEILDEDET